MGVYGDGSDGNVTISTDTTLTGNKQYNNLTINSGITLNVNDYIVRVLDTLTNNGTIIGKATAGGAGAPTKVNTGHNGGASNVGTAGTNGSGDGGNSGAGGGQLDYRPPGGDWRAYLGGNGGAGGNGGFGCGDITIYAYNFNNANTINSSGGDGSSGSDGTAGETPPTGGGGGGQGGEGGDAGDISITYENLINIGTLLRNGGIRGANGNGGSGSGQAGWESYSYAGQTGNGGGDGGNGGGESSSMIATPGKVGHWNKDGIGGIITLTTTAAAPIVTHGIKIINNSNSQILSSELITIISCGTITMPNSLNGDNTYGYDIDLPGTAAIPIEKLGVIILPATNITWEATGIYFCDIASPNQKYFPTAYLTNTNYSYYTKNDDTGVMTSFTPGARTNGDSSTWDGIVSIFPIYGWDRLGTSLTSIRLWAATCYIILDGMATTKAVFSIGNTGGITSVNYAIFLKEWDY